MNRRPPILKLSKALTGFIQYKAAEGLSHRTLESYEQQLKQLLEHVGDVDVGEVQAQDLRDYLAWMRNEYKPRRFSGSEHPLSPKTIRNIWVGLSAFFRWVSTELNIPNPMKGVPAPRFEEVPVEPFTREEIEALLKACEYCQLAETTDRRRFAMRRPTGKRDRALILTLLDTGRRASELCALKIGDVDAKTGRVQIKHGLQGWQGSHGLSRQGRATGLVAVSLVAGRRRG